MSPRRLSFDLYCRVVDNYGDAGVCWRLARQLAREHDAAVCLWIDAPATLAVIEPRAPQGRVDGVRIVPWPAGATTPPDTSPARQQAAPTPADAATKRPAADEATAARIVVSAFGCDLPPAVRRRIAESRGAIPWINLEYLSAEDWVEGCHGLASTKPDDGAVEFFFYPGFTSRTGGLLRERGLIEARDAFLAGGGRDRWLAQRVGPPAPGQRQLSLFCYPEAPVAEWLETLAQGPTPTRVLLAEGAAQEAAAAYLGAPLAVGAQAGRGRLTLRRLGWLTQDDYDRLLWSCDLNLVRGEDSWIRAHWAGRPFVWQPYRQANGVHRNKLEAFLEKMQSVAPAAEAAAMMRAWSEGAGVAAAWRALEGALPALEGAFRRWSRHLAAEPDLASRLVEFSTRRL